MQFSEMLMKPAQIEGNGNKAMKPRLMAVQRDGSQAGRSGLEPLEWTRVRDLTSRNISKFLAFLPHVASPHNTTVIHKVRALSRRVELLLELFYGKPFPRHAHKLHRRVRSCRHVLSRLSDYDALLAIAAHSTESAPELQKAAWKLMDQYLRAQRNRKAPKILRTVGELDFASPAARIKCDIDADKLSWRQSPNRRAAKKADQVTEQRTRHIAGHLWNHFESLLEESQRDPCEQSIHDVRIAVKKLRNVVAVMNKLNMAGASTHLAWLRSLQRAIGEWHDLEVLEHTMAGLLLRKKFLRDHLELAVEIEQLLLQNREVKKRSEGSFARMTLQSRDYEQMKIWARELTRAGGPSITVTTEAGAEKSPVTQVTLKAG
jgi:CHAD domain-containing protein